MCPLLRGRFLCPECPLLEVPLYILLLYCLTCLCMPNTYMQLWARAFRDQTYHAAINTTNGVESQNKLLQYNYLPRKKNLTLSQLVILLYNEFLPESHHKHLYLNYRMSSAHREYSDFIPEYLRGRPRQVIIHCLNRKSESMKYTEEDILTKDVVNGRFTFQGSQQVHTIDFCLVSGKPSCTCPDWLQWHIPCKHFFAIFRLVEKWGWDALPEIYRKMSYLCTDNSSLNSQLSSSILDAGDSLLQEGGTEDGGFEDPLPRKKVGECMAIGNRCELVVSLLAFILSRCKE